ncbi:MAG: transcription termination/antitermination protein NusG [Christensenellaceae bacterium]|jgi:transcriptional antiterminator NusG|nr:transcription termination/antitermination protein NusG [Christensenellaceae bacterium]
MDNKENAKWYVLHTYASYETVVKNNLNKMIENNGLQDYIFEIEIPVEEEVVEKNGKRKIVERKKFPGYVFIKMIHTDHVWYMVTNTRGVTGFVGPQSKALPLTADEIKRMGLEKVATKDFTINVGDTIRIISGALDTFVGSVEEVYNEKEKVRAFVQLFGRPTPVELDFSQIEKI